MNGLEQKRLARKALNELKRTNPDQYAMLNQKKTEAQTKAKRYLVQAKRGASDSLWVTLDSTDIQGEAVQFVCEQRWSKRYPDVSWKILDTEWLRSNRGKSVVMWVRGDDKAPLTGEVIPLPTAPLFPLESFVRAAQLQEDESEE